MAKERTTRKAAEDEPQYIELVNWAKAQPTIPEKEAPWVKLYTSLLDNDAFGSLDDSARMLIVALWLYAGRSGRHVLPADPKWLRRKIPMLNQDPDLRPLLDAKDAYGQPKPFIRILDKEGIYNVQNSTELEREKREKKSKSKTKPLRASEKNEKKEKKRVSSTPMNMGKQKGEPEPESQQKTKDQTLPQTQDQTRAEPVSPRSPTKPEGGGPLCVHTPKAPPTASRLDMHRMGKIPIWWADPACTAFSYAVFEALGIRGDPESQHGKSERGTYAAWLFEARGCTAQSDWQWLEAKAVAKAREIAKYGRKARSPGAVWLSIMRKELQARAGPGAATG